MSTYQVGYFVGSLSSTSINRILSRALIKLAPEDLEFTEIPIGNLPLYSPDYDADYPPEARALKEAIAGSDAVLFVTPEYNRSIPGALKNAIDWASRPWGQNSFDHMPAARHRRLARARSAPRSRQQSLRGVLSFCNARQMTAPEAYISLRPEAVHRRRRGHRRLDRDLPERLHAGVPRPHRAGPDRPAARLTPDRRRPAGSATPDIRQHTR